MRSTFYVQRNNKARSTVSQTQNISVFELPPRVFPQFDNVSNQAEDHADRRKYYRSENLREVVLAGTTRSRRKSKLASHVQFAILPEESTISIEL